MGFAEQYGIIERTLIENRNNEYTESSIGRSRGVRTITKEKPGVSPLVLTDFLLEHAVFLRLPDVSNSLPPFNERIVEVCSVSIYGQRLSIARAFANPHKKTL